MKTTEELGLKPIEQLYMVWVAGTRKPRFVHTDLARAEQEAHRLRGTDRGRGREVYIMAPVMVIPGRRVLKLNRKHFSRAEMEPEQTP